MWSRASGGRSEKTNSKTLFGAAQMRPGSFVDASQSVGGCRRRRFPDPARAPSPMKRIPRHFFSTPLGVAIRSLEAESAITAYP
jgi:hypothetical protein